MANDIFTRAKAYRKKHPSTAWADCVKACAGKKSAAPKKKRAAPKKRAADRKKISGARKKKAAPPKAARKVKAKIKTGKKGGALTISLSGIHLTKTREELAHQHALERDLQKHKDILKIKGQPAAEKNRIRREIKKYQDAIRTSKQHVTALKRSI